MRTFFTAVALLVAIALPAQAQDKYKAGLADIITTDPVDGVKMSGLVTYPTNDLGEPTQIALFTVNAWRRATVAPGRFPLIIFSHNAGGSRLDHHDSLEALTKAGFIAAAIEHPRDNYRDQTGQGTDRQFIGRSHHIKAFIDGLLADSDTRSRDRQDAHRHRRVRGRRLYGADEHRRQAEFGADRGIRQGGSRTIRSSRSSPPPRRSAGGRASRW